MAEEKHIVKILSTNWVTHNVKRFKLEKPAGYKFIPGQATEIAVNKEGWDDQAHPFTFTGLNDWNYLEFTIKIYNDHNGVTKQLGTLEPGDTVILHDVWGAIQYNGEGTFIAGGAGVTPFIAIFRQLFKEGKIGGNQLLFSNRTRRDIIAEDEFRLLLGDQFVPTLTREEAEGYDNRMITTDYLKEKIGDKIHQNFYICGPDPMIAAIKKSLEDLGAGENAITIEV